MRTLLAFLVVVLCGGVDASGVRASKINVTAPPMFGPTAITVPEAYRQDLTFSAPLDGNTQLVAWGRGSTVATFTRNSIATYLSPSTGLITQVGANVPRFESPGGYLSEGQRINSLVYSNSPNGAGWIKGQVTVTQFADTSPDGTLNAHLIGAVANSGSIYQPITLASGTDTASIWIKRASGTGKIYLTPNAVTATGWVEVTVASAYTRVSVSQLVANPTFGLSFQTAGDEVYIYQGQLEAGAFMSSAIPTTTTAVTRVADVLTYPATGNDTLGPGTKQATVDASNTAASALYEGRTANGQNGSWFDYTGSTGIVTFTVKSGNVAQAIMQSSGVLGTSRRCTIAWALNDAQAFVDGVSVGSDTSVALPLSLYRIGILTDFVNTGQPYGHMSNASIFSSRLSAWEINQIK